MVSSPTFVDQFVIVHHQQHRARIALQGYVQGVDVAPISSPARGSKLLYRSGAAGKLVPDQPGINSY